MYTLSLCYLPILLPKILLFQLNGHAPTNIQNKCECIFKKDQQQKLNAVRKLLSEKDIKTIRQQTYLIGYGTHQFTIK